MTSSHSQKVKINLGLASMLPLAQLTFISSQKQGLLSLLNFYYLAFYMFTDNIPEVCNLWPKA